MHPSHDASKNTDAIMVIVVVFGYCSTNQHRRPEPLGPHTYIHGTLELGSKQNPSQYPGIPPKGDKAHEPGEQGIAVKFGPLENHRVWSQSMQDGDAYNPIDRWNTEGTGGGCSQGRCGSRNRSTGEETLSPGEESCLGFVAAA